MECLHIPLCLASRKGDLCNLTAPSTSSKSTAKAKSKAQKTPRSGGAFRSALAYSMASNALQFCSSIGSASSYINSFMARQNPRSVATVSLCPGVNQIAFSQPVQSTFLGCFSGAKFAITKSIINPTPYHRQCFRCHD